MVGDAVVNRVEFVRGWDEFTDFYELEAGFILSFLLHRDRGIYYVKVFDGTLCIKPWLGKKIGGAGKPTGAA